MIEGDRGSRSNGCVEVASVDARVAVRDSKHKDGPVLVLVPTEWDAFLGGVDGGEFDFRVCAAQTPERLPSLAVPVVSETSR
jgi:hypothetical protein